MKKTIYSIFILTIIVSCAQQESSDLEFKKEIQKRIGILEKSYKFSINAMNLHGKNFEKLKVHINGFTNKNPDNNPIVHYDEIFRLFQIYNIQIQYKTKSKGEKLFGILLGLDELIFKYVPSRLNLSDYKTLVVPNNYNLKEGDTLKAKIYLTASDSLYEPEFKHGEYYLPCENGVGEYNMLVNGIGEKEVKGIAIYSTELGTKDTLVWQYNFEVK